MYELFVLSACKDTTNNPNMQVFMQKNDICLQKSLFFSTYVYIQRYDK